jgi:hypothetical protein
MVKSRSKFGVARTADLKKAELRLSFFIAGSYGTVTGRLGVATLLYSSHSSRGVLRRPVTQETLSWRLDRESRIAVSIASPFRQLVFGEHDDGSIDCT